MFLYSIDGRVFFFFYVFVILGLVRLFIRRFFFFPFFSAATQSIRRARTQGSGIQSWHHSKTTEENVRLSVFSSPLTLLLHNIASKQQKKEWGTTT